MYLPVNHTEVFDGLAVPDGRDTGFGFVIGNPIQQASSRENSLSLNYNSLLAFINFIPFIERKQFFGLALLISSILIATMTL